MSYQELPLITDANDITLANSLETFKELSSNEEEKGDSEHE